jgi:dihydrofolate synthase/folylpolyglutamate synthase
MQFPLVPGSSLQTLSLQDWLEWLEQCHPKEIDLGLDRIRQVAERLNLLTPAARIITVAGTNGKGSCATTAAVLLRESGLRVGVYTSPHLIHYNERIVVDGVTASDNEICQAFIAIASACDDISLTYFEYGTLAALEIFNRRKVDVMVLEVGLGGRLDAVNILAPDVAVITSIDLDHSDWLGNTRESIGIEKAGIMRTNRPVVCADPEPPVSLFTTAQVLGAQWYGVGQAYGYRVDSSGWSWWGQDIKAVGLELIFPTLPSLPLPSIAAAMQAVALLGVDLSSLSLSQTISQLCMPGRFQSVIYHGREIILDVAHNPAASAYLYKRLQNSPCAGRTFALVAMMADKDKLNSLRNLAPAIDAWYLADLADIPRAAPVEQLEQDLARLGLSVAGRGSVAECLKLLCACAGEFDRIVVWGSFYTVAAALAVVQSQ